MTSQYLKFLASLLVFRVACSYPINDPPVSVQRSKDCPEGTELVGKACVLTEILQPNLVCPPSTTLLDGDCVTFVKASRTCPEGFTRVGDRCTSTEVIPAVPTCDQGEVYGDQCRVESPVPSTCPVGFQLQDQQCLRYSPQSETCPTSYQLQGHKCLKTTKSPADPVCPPDYSLGMDEMCMKSVPVPPHCDPGFSLVGDECIKQLPRIPAPCPDGFKSLAKSCYREQQSEPRPECPADFVLGPQNQCTKEIPTAPTCPQGSTRGTTGQCEHSVAKRPVCDNGEELVNGRCKRTSLHTPQLTCPNGYGLVDRDCKKAFIEKPLSRCPRGSLEDGKCVVRSTTPTRLECPPGYQIDKGFRCVRDVAYDCPKPAECNEGPLATENPVLRQLYPSSKDKTSPQYNPKKNIKVTVNAEKSTDCFTQQTCTRTEFAPVHYACPDGSRPEGKNCNLISTYPPQVYCRTGNLDKEKGMCVTVDKRPAVNVCAVGLLQPDETCLEVNERPATLVCPDESQNIDGRCVVLMPDVNHPNKVIRQTPRGICDEGFRRGHFCVQVEEMPRDQICPSGTEDRSGHCVVSRPPVTPNPVTVTQPPKYVCPDGRAATGKSCFDTDVIPPEHVCLNGGSMQDSRCVHAADLIDHPPKVSHFPARFTCPSEYKQEGRRCSLTTTEPANLECPSGFSRFDGPQECSRSHERIPVCPPGTEKVDENCVKKTHTPPRVTEVKVCTKGQPGC